MSFNRMSVRALQEKLNASDELAFLDVREHGVHAQGHPLWAVPMPLSSLELKVEILIPRKDVDIYLLDQGDGDNLSERAAAILQVLGYTSLFIVEGGVTAWHAEGLEVFSGVNVPSKAFGEFVEHQCDTPHISADDLAQKLASGEAVTVLDSRPFAEFNRMSIPESIDMPGAELVHRVFETVPDETSLIVVNCAGRTRSIIGAQSLINAGVKNPVMALKDGTMGWYLAGHDLARNETVVAGEPGDQAFQKSLQAARDVGSKCAVMCIDVSLLSELQGREDKTLFILDVRTNEEFLENHVAGSSHAPGGQLVQATDEYVAVRNATLVLVDDREVRAWMTASWLKQLGWEDVFVLTDFSGCKMENGEQVPTVELKALEVSALELDAVIASGEAAAVLDLSDSLSYRAGHIPGAFWAIRSRLEQDLIFLPPVGYIVLTAEDVRLAHLAVDEVARIRPDAIVHVLKDGNQGWRDAKLKIEEGDTSQLSRPDDIWYKPYDNKEKIRERMQEYLDWEVALVPQVERDGTARFKILTE
ncbi:MAG: rhodanese-like domain-containing protein [Sneathiella sp.]